MRALSIRQPWAHLIVADRRKNIEIRTWNTNFRGEFLIHAGKLVDLGACKLFGMNPDTLVTGAIVGKAVLADVRRYQTVEEFDMDAPRHLNPPSRFVSPCFGFVLVSIERITPVPHRGKLGFFEVFGDTK